MATASSLSTPSVGALIVCCIFIASRTSTVCPAVTSAPASRGTPITVPGIGASSEPWRHDVRRVDEPGHGAQVQRAHPGVDLDVAHSRGERLSDRDVDPGADPVDLDRHAVGCCGNHAHVTVS